MSLYFGSNKLKDLYLGSNKIKEVYLGNTMLYPSLEPSINIITAGWTIRTTGNNRVVATMDPAGGTSKIIYETVTQLDDLLYPLQGGFVSSFMGSEVWYNDQYAAFAPSAGIYNSVWTNASNYYDNSYPIYCNFGSTNTGMITDVYTMDFFNQQKQVNGMNFFRSTSSLPHRACDIIGAGRITKLNQSFTGYKNVKTPVIPFISSCLASMTGLTAINRPLQGSCTGSPDYTQATAQYPNWF